MRSIVDKQAEELTGKYPGTILRVRADGSCLVNIPNYFLPVGWNKQTTNVYFVVPVGYPTAKPDCFWTDKDLTLANGATPANASVNANHGEAEQLLWFSYHLSSWNPNTDNLLTYVRVIQKRLEELR
jgi:hypothetical protein